MNKITFTIISIGHTDIGDAIYLVNSSGFGIIRKYQQLSEVKKNIADFHQ